MHLDLDHFSVSIEHPALRGAQGIRHLILIERV